MGNQCKWSAESDYAIKSVQRAMEIMCLFLPDNRPLTQQEICEKTGMNKSTVLRMVYTLVEGGFLKQVESGRGFVIGTQAMRLGMRAVDSLSLTKVATPILSRLSNESGFVTHLGIFERNNVVVVAKTFPTNSSFSTRLQATVGGILPVYCTGIGLLFLAQRSDEEALEIVKGCDRIRYTTTTETDIDAIMERIRKTRETGFVINNGEHDEGVVGACFPIYDHTCKMVAGMSLGGIREVIYRYNMEKVKEQTRRAALDISRELGYYI